MSTTTSERLATAKAVAASSRLQSRRSLYVGGLADEAHVTDATLRAALIPFGPIRSLDVPKDYQKGDNRHKGFCFVEYEEADDAAEAMFNLDGAELYGRTLTVNLAQQQQQSGSISGGGAHKLGSMKPVWSSDDWFQQQAGEENAEQRQQQETKLADANTLKDD